MSPDRMKLQVSLRLAFLGGGVSAFFFFGTACATAISLRARAIWSSRYDLYPASSYVSASNFVPLLAHDVSAGTSDLASKMHHIVITDAPLEMCDAQHMMLSCCPLSS